MIRDHYHMHTWTLVNCFGRYVVNMGLHGVSPLGTKEINHTLLIASVERWRQETQTFHHPVGEAIVMPQDVVALLGQWAEMELSLASQRLVTSCYKLLDITPDAHSLDQANLRIQWFWEHFIDIPPSDGTDDVVRQDARAYILVLIRSVLFTDKSGGQCSLVTSLPMLQDFEEADSFLWDRAVQSCVYRGVILCNPNHQ